LPLPRAKGVRTQGLRYELNSEMLELGVREGQSNEVLSSDSPVRISITAGALIVFVLRRAFG
ncbi:MAG: hypothetical protein KDD64_15770, partial [Bdellovibrionales bacterium]|nr:hypothetical protein [Bdellovibrionales bacterium]